MLAVIAVSTKMHSSPSRKTKTPISKTCAREPAWRAKGLGFPEVAIPCHTIRAATSTTQGINKIREACFFFWSIWSVLVEDITIRSFYISDRFDRNSGTPIVLAKTLAVESQLAFPFARDA